MRIFILPNEVLLFRTGHPFDAGENHYAETLFPPTPETLQGAIRATIAAYWNPAKMLAEAFQEQGLVALIGDQEHYGRFCITSFTPGRRDKDAVTGSPVERLFPMPAHLLREEGGKKQQIHLRPGAHNTGIHSNLPGTLQLLYPHKVVQGKLEPIRGWLTEQGLHKALHGKEEIVAHEIVDPTEMYVHELRPGIGMNSQSKTTLDGQFYQVRMLRMNHRSEDPFSYGFVVDIRLLQTHKAVASQQFVSDTQTQRMLRLPDEGWMLLGGERRAARFEVLSPSTGTSEQPEQWKKGNLLYLATPAAFTRGWQPAVWPIAEPIAIAMERYQSIGGWQLTPGSNGGKSKTLRRCAPAGSIFFFDSSVQKVLPFTDYGAQIGYGITYLGEYVR